MPSSYNHKDKLLELFKWIRKASTEYKLDSPFLYDFYKKVIKEKVLIGDKIADIERIRGRYLKNHDLLEVRDFGAGSSYHSSTKRSVSSIAKSAVSGQRKCLLLYKLARFYGATNILELGTSLGIATLYLKAACPTAKVLTIEGDPTIMQLFKSSRPKWAQNIQTLNGRFDKVIEQIDLNQKFDFIYIDGGHHSEILFPLLESLKPFLLPKTVLIIDDIYWSWDMKNSWTILKSNNRYNVCIDLWYFGILSFDRRQKERLDVVLSPIKLWWQMGFFR